MELAPLPRSWVETTGDLVFWGQHRKVCSRTLSSYGNIDANSELARVDTLQRLSNLRH